MKMPANLERMRIKDAPQLESNVDMRNLLILIMCSASGITLANPPDKSCNISIGELPIAPAAEVVVSNCIDELECWMGFSMKKQHGEFYFSGIAVKRTQDPKMFLELSTFPNGKAVGARISGQATFFEGLTIYSNYKAVNGCEIVSVQRIQHNKKHNEMDAAVVTPIR